MRWTLFNSNTAHVQQLVISANSVAAPAEAKLTLIKDTSMTPTHSVWSTSGRQKAMTCGVTTDSVHLDNELNALYKDVMAKFRLFDVKQSDP